MATPTVEEDDIQAASHSELNTDSNSLDTAIVQDEDPPDCTNCSVFILNQDCLLKIFSYLSMENLLSVERVCPQWQTTAELSWRRFNTFDCTKSFHRYSEDALKRCLIHCGPYLKKIYFPPLLNDGKATELLGITARHCPNLEYAVLKKIQFTKTYIKNLTQILSHLKCLEIEDAEFELTYFILKQLFKKVSQLECLTFKDYYSKNPLFISKAFQFLPKSITAIHFGHLNYPDVDFFALLLKYCPNLEVLTMSAEPCSNTGPGIAKFTKLRQLELYYCEMKLENMKHFLSLNLLEKLVLSCPSVMNDDFLEKVAESMPLLQHLDINAASESDVTDKGVEKLAKLKNLEYLNLSYYNSITHKGIGAVASNGKLKELILISTMVTDSVISAVLTPCHELKFLDLSACYGITEESVNTLLEIFTPTNKRAKLTVVVGGTWYVKSELIKDEEEAADLKDLFVRNLTILKNYNFVDSKLRRRCGGILNPSDDEFDEYDEYDDWYDFSDDEYEVYEEEIDGVIFDLD